MSTPPPPPSSSRFAPYRQALKAISARTGTALPTLVVSFAVVHELTAVVPIVGFFFGARALGVGERVVQSITSTEDGAPDGWAKAKCREWVDEGGQWAQRVGRRYGVFGFEKRDRNAPEDRTNTAADAEISARLAGDAANAVLAYGLTKVGLLSENGGMRGLTHVFQALLPVRIGISLYLAPGFARRVINPLQRIVLRPFRRRSN